MLYDGLILFFYIYTICVSVQIQNVHALCWLEKRVKG